MLTTQLRIANSTTYYRVELFNLTRTTLQIGENRTVQKKNYERGGFLSYRLTFRKRRKSTLQYFFLTIQTLLKIADELVV